MRSRGPRYRSLLGVPWKSGPGIGRVPEDRDIVEAYDALQLSGWWCQLRLFVHEQNSLVIR